MFEFGPRIAFFRSFDDAVDTRTILQGGKQAVDADAFYGRRGQCLLVAPQTQAVAHGLYALTLFQRGGQAD